MTMPELLVVLVVFSIVAAMGFPYVMGYVRAARVKAGAQEFAAIASGARQLAIARNTNVCITLNGTQARYMVGTTTACGGGAAFVGTMTQADGTIPLSNNMEISGANANVVFTNLGAATPAGVYTVRDPSTNRTLTVVISASGRIRVQ
jgi:prepilin-type N-terminal cleavage/methylation domain-containing protein